MVRERCRAADAGDKKCGAHQLERQHPAVVARSLQRAACGDDQVEQLSPPSSLRPGAPDSGVVRNVQRKYTTGLHGTHLAGATAREGGVRGSHREARIDQGGLTLRSAERGNRSTVIWGAPIISCLRDAPKILSQPAKGLGRACQNVVGTNQV